MTTQAASRARPAARAGGSAPSLVAGPPVLRPLKQQLMAALALVLAVAAAGCAKREPPSGGPPDIDPPRMVSSQPDSGAAGVPIDVHPSITFGESMEPRSSGESVSIAPRVPIRQRRWSGRTLTLVFAEPLKQDQTYTMFVSNTARDRHGNDMETGATVVFSTAATFPPGRIEGEIDARGFSAPGTYLWCYEAHRTGVPDSTARDFDALGLADTDDDFRIDGLKVPGEYKVWAFADLNANRSFEPAIDVLAPVDTVIALTTERPVASGLALRILNPRAPGTIKGTVLDSLPDTSAVVRVLAVATDDSTSRALAEVGRDGAWELSLRGGTWLIRVFRDADRDRDLDANEVASEAQRVELEPAGEVVDIKLVLPPRPGGP